MFNNIIMFNYTCRSSVKKVANILDGIDQRKFRDKFGDQFNYVHDTA